MCLCHYFWFIFRMCLRRLFSIDSRCQQESPWISSYQVAQDRELNLYLITCTNYMLHILNCTHLPPLILSLSSYALTESWGAFALVFWLRTMLPLTWWSHYKSALQITVALYSKYNTALLYFRLIDWYTGFLFEWLALELSLSTWKQSAPALVTLTQWVLNMFW